MNQMCGCQTAIFTHDQSGANAAYSVVEVYDLLDEDMQDLSSDDYELDGFYPADENTVDVDVWGQEFSDGCRNALRDSQRDGNLFVARFVSDGHGIVEVLVWNA